MREIQACIKWAGLAPRVRSSTVEMPRGELWKELPRKKRRQRERAAKKAKKVAAQQSRNQRAGRREGSGRNVSFSERSSRGGRREREESRKVRHRGDKI